MCGIVGYAGKGGGAGEGRQAQSVLLEGLRRLEYRGYDSAGVAVNLNGALHCARAPGKLSQLEAKLRAAPLAGHCGIGHTRWATHGAANEANAHPQLAGEVAVVHNGIVENERELRAQLQSAGCKLESQTDTELIAQLIAQQLRAGKALPAAVRAAMQLLQGSSALAAVCAAAPDEIVAAKFGGSPLIIGLAEGETFLASDAPALLPYTRKLLFMEDGEFARITPNGAQLCDAEGRAVQRAPRTIAWDPVSAEKGGYDHFMHKEIHEQARALHATIGARLQEGGAAPAVALEDAGLSDAAAKQITRITLVACGTAYYACLIGKHLLEGIAGVPADADYASEFRHRKPLLQNGHWVVPVSQSGETADTLAALHRAREAGARTLGICNTPESALSRAADAVLYTRAGPEIGVASTKCFSAQFAALYLLALKLGLARGNVSAEAAAQHFANLRALPRKVEETLRGEAQVQKAAARFFRARHCLFLGRGIMHPIAMEGALKLKEISYIHAEGYPAGEMKHGPIALVDEHMPVVIIANQGPVYAKVLANMEEVRARGGRVIAVASQGDSAISERADAVLPIPELGEYLTALLAAIPVQLLAYHIALLRGTDIDQPRNLAKSVTVE